MQLGNDCADGLPGGALGPVEDVDVASGMYSAERLEDDVGVRPSGPTGQQREAAAGGDGLGDHREFVDAVDDVEPTVRDARDGLDDGHQREAVVHRDPRLVRHVPRREQRLGRQLMARRQGDIDGLAQQRGGGRCPWPRRPVIEAVGEHEIVVTGKSRDAVLGDVLVRESQAGLSGVGVAAQQDREEGRRCAVECGQRDGAVGLLGEIGDRVPDLDEIRRLATIAKDAGLRVHMDGARFANALDHLGVTPAEMTWKAGIDVLSFGATKNGAMTAEAIVSFDPALATELAFRAKRAGQLASKMRFHTVQFDAYLTDGLWLRNARRANTMAARLGDGLKAIPGTELVSSPQANILFCRLPQQATEGLLAEGYTFYHDRWAPGIVRLVTSFSHTPEDIDQLLDAVRRHTR